VTVLTPAWLATSTLVIIFDSVLERSVRLAFTGQLIDGRRVQELVRKALNAPVTFRYTVVDVPPGLSVAPHSVATKQHRHANQSHQGKGTGLGYCGRAQREVVDADGLAVEVR